MAEVANAVMPLLTPIQLSMLARQIVAGEEEDERHIEEVLKIHRITREQFTAILRNPFFTNALDSARLEWNSIENNAQRLAYAGQWFTEQLLPIVTARAMDASENLANVVKAAEFLASVGGVKAPGGQVSDPKERISITIDLGPDNIVKIEGSKGGEEKDDRLLIQGTTDP
jgi:hypothetical protein